MRRLASLAGLLTGILAVSSTIAAAGELTEMELRTGATAVKYTLVKFGPEVPSPQPFAPRPVATPSQSGPALNAGAQTRMKVVARCGTSNYHCNPPTPVCCGVPGKYYCAKDPSGCNQH
jgi:hypothetical protein